VSDAPYDTREAIDLLACAAEADQPDRRGKRAAARALLDALLVLSGKTTAQITKIERREPVVQIGIGAHYIWIMQGENDGLIVVSRGSERTAVEGIRYNPVTKKFEGEAHDPRVTPIPGEPLPRRSALAVVIEAALKCGRILPLS
jgi:hypothetical protein